MGVIVLWTLVLAVIMAERDAAAIKAGAEINHVLWWWIRAIAVAVPCVVIGKALLSIGMAGLFSAVFRWELNALRGVRCTYISRSNLYDSAFIMLAGSADAGGRLAYLVELTTAVVVVGWCI